MFPKNSAFGQEDERRRLMEAAAGGPAEAQEFIDPVHKVDTSSIRVTASVPVDVLEGWIQSIELIENDGDAIDVADRLRLYLPG